jgi:hypothetical protein
MLVTYLIQLIETHAEGLTREVLGDVRSNPRTRFLRELPEEELYQKVYDFYHHLGRWVAEMNEADIEAVYSDLGRRRRAEGAPLSEVVYTVILVKEHLWNYITRNDVLGSVVELYQEKDLVFRVGHFFDKALYYAVRGYEGAEVTGTTGRSI